LAINANASTEALSTPKTNTVGAKTVASAEPATPEIANLPNSSPTPVSQPPGASEPGNQVPTTQAPVQRQVEIHSADSASNVGVQPKAPPVTAAEPRAVTSEVPSHRESQVKFPPEKVTEHKLPSAETKEFTTGESSTNGLPNETPTLATSPVTPGANLYLMVGSMLLLIAAGLLLWCFRSNRSHARPSLISRSIEGGKK